METIRYEGCTPCAAAKKDTSIEKTTCASVTSSTLSVGVNPYEWFHDLDDEQLNILLAERKIKSKKKEVDISFKTKKAELLDTVNKTMANFVSDIYNEFKVPEEKRSSFFFDF